ncbi:MAG TPA: DUF3500 domain-containing protein [Polyangiaceae bacterium]|nr:DUF3500 domain-containing protein [Polyangiaceae bacterium]
MRFGEIVLERLTGGAWIAALLLSLPLSVATVGARAAEPTASAAAQELVALTAGEARAKLLQPFSDEARSDWSYVPRERAGVAWKELNPAQRTAATTLLRTALSAPGLDKIHAVMALEIALRELESGSPRRDPENYAIAIFGTPSASGEAWGFRLEGHHLSLHFTLQNDRFLSTLPQFMGSNPALVPRDMPGGGPRAGTRVLGEEEDLARRLMGALDPARAALAHFDTRTYGDIYSKNAKTLQPMSPVGVEFRALPAAEQATLLRLIAVFASHLRPELSEARLARVRSGGLDSIRFGWAGSLERGKPFYYRIQGATFLIELDNSGGNHIHSVWRDFEGDWGRDVLGEHYRNAGAPHGHSH